MPISHGDHLFTLVKSLSKAEKRNFRLYVRRIQGEGDAKFLQLFDLLDKSKELDEEALRNKLKGTSKSQFSNLKRHLYQHILTSLRLIQVRKSEAIQIREWMDYAQILYGKGLYLQSLKLLDRAKAIAKNMNLDALHLEIVEFEKRIESRHITRSTTERMVNLTQEASERNRIQTSTIELANLKLLLQRRFINEGHVSSTEERATAEHYFRRKMPPLPEEKLTFFERIHLYQAYYWQAYLLMDFDTCFYWTQRWVELYEAEPRMIEMDVDMYMRALHQLLTIAYLTREVSTYRKYLDTLEHFRESEYKKFNHNSKILSFLVVHQGRYNKHFLEGTYREGLKAIPRTLQRLKRYGQMVDTHKVFILYYKMAWLHLCCGEASKAVDYLNLILNHPGKPLREDIQAFTHLSFLLCQYELGNFDLLDYRLTQTTRYIRSLRDQYQHQEACLSLFRQLLQHPPQEAQQVFREQLPVFQKLEQQPYEWRAFTFMRMTEWLSAKAEGQTLEEVRGQKSEIRNQPPTLKLRRP